MNTEQTIEAEVVKTDAVAVVKPPEAPPPVTAEQAKVKAIADLTHSAYQKAATLMLTREESEALTRDFPDEAFKPGAAGKENLIYIEHAFLRDRFNEVFGLGQWAIIPRSRWAEAFKTGQGKDGSRVYVEAMLVVRGCFVGEAVGEMEYYPHNASQNYGDAVEGAKTAAFRRCAKEFGVGLQAWKKDWCQGWWDRKMHPGKRVYPPKPQSEAPKPPPEAPKPKSAAPKPEATEDTKLRFIEKLEPNRQHATQFCIELGWLLPPDETLEDLSLRFVPVTVKQYESFVECLNAFVKDGKVGNPYLPNKYGDTPKESSSSTPRGTIGDDAPESGEFCPPPPGIEVPREDVDEPGDQDAWRTFPMPWGKHAGVPLEDLEKNYLYGLWLNYFVETEFKGKPKRPETIAKDQMFRAMLDLAGAHYNFQKKD